MWILSLLHVKPKSCRRSRADRNPEGTVKELSNSLDHRQLVVKIADLLKEFDSNRPVHKKWKPGIGPFDEDPLVKEIARQLTEGGITAETQAEVDRVKKIDMVIGDQWVIEFKLARPYRNNGDVEDIWSKRLTYPYEGNESLLGDAVKLSTIDLPRKCVFAIGYERDGPLKISLEPVFRSFEVIAESVMGLKLGPRVEEARYGLVHPVHQTLRCASWEVRDSS